MQAPRQCVHRGKKRVGVASLDPPGVGGWRDKKGSSKKMQVERPVKRRKPGRCGVWGPKDIGLQEEGMTGVKKC